MTYLDLNIISACQTYKEDISLNPTETGVPRATPVNTKNHTQ
jgi:hypothetical protein